MTLIILSGIFFLVLIGFCLVGGGILLFTGKKPKLLPSTNPPAPVSARSSPEELLGDAGELIQRTSVRKAWAKIGDYVSENMTAGVADAISQGVMRDEVSRQGARVGIPKG